MVTRDGEYRKSMFQFHNKLHPIPSLPLTRVFVAALKDKNTEAKFDSVFKYNQL